MPWVTLLKTLCVPSQSDNGRKRYYQIQGTFHINRLGRKNDRFDTAKLIERFQEEKGEKKKRQQQLLAFSCCSSALLNPARVLLKADTNKRQDG